MNTSMPSYISKMSTVDALWVLIQNQSKAVRKELAERMLTQQEQAKTEKQQMMVEESLTRAFEQLRSGRVHHDARNMFKK